MVADKLLPSIISVKCPNNPKPVTSVIACTSFIFPNASPALLIVVNWFTKKFKSSSVSKPLFCAVAMMPTPNGLVNINTSPGCAVSFLFKFSMSIIPFTTKPKIGSWLSILCPPAITIPASAQVLRAPSITFAASLAGSEASGQPNTAKANIGFPPIAYTSLIALAAAICPNENASSTIGIKKSVVLITAVFSSI